MKYCCSPKSTKQHQQTGYCLNSHGLNTWLKHRFCPLKGTNLVCKKCSSYRPGVAQTVGRGIALLFHDCGTRRGWVVSSTPRPYFTSGKDLVPILREAGWAPEPVWMGRKSHPHGDSIPDHPARSQSLYRLSYPAHLDCITFSKTFENEVKSDTAE